MLSIYMDILNIFMWVVIMLVIGGNRKKWSDLVFGFFVILNILFNGVDMY